MAVGHSAANGRALNALVSADLNRQRLAVMARCAVAGQRSHVGCITQRDRASPSHMADGHRLDQGSSRGDVVKVVLADLKGTFSPRQRLDDAHVRVLAECVDELPPILLHGPTRRVIDGMHRVAAHELARRSVIEAEVFAGTTDDAAVEAVQRNVAHGLPLRIEDRKRAARAILTAQPDWSDRRVAGICGLSPKTAGALRAATEEFPQLPSRVGRDGRRRTVPPRQPSRDPRIDRRDNDRLAVPAPVHTPTIDLALLSAARGDELLEWLDRTDPSDWPKVADVVPLSRVYELAALARDRAAEWQQLARALEDRAAR
jgi:hypothetical protein